ncbi:MAG: hypothetical protein ABSH32_18825 [Bryobacteraceae bacterium]
MIRAIFVFGCFVGLSLTASPPALGGDNGATSTSSYTPVAEGSTPTHRSLTDTFSGQVNIYVGGSFPAGTNLVAFQYLFDLTTAGNTSGYITPLLFEYKPVEAFTVYTVVGIGRGFEIKQLGSVPQAIPFDVIEGTKVPTSGNFTFGFTTALVNSDGVPVATSPGVVDFDAPSDGGQGVGGPLTTNDWAITLGRPGPPPVVALGTTFGVYGADYALNSPAAQQSYRTYSARAIGMFTQ